MGHKQSLAGETTLAQVGNEPLTLPRHDTPCRAVDHTPRRS
jgi:hypothetical protein